jgi:tRNA (guanine37-N1)-methyltransferase
VTGPTFEIFTLFPEAIAGFLRGGLVGKAVEHGLVGVHCTDYRAFTSDRHRTVDDAPYGGGPGMVMMAAPVVAALEAVAAARGPMHRVLLTPSAPRFDQAAARRLAGLPRIALLCGRYEGIDDRVREHFVDECLSLGDFVLNGGEVAALAIVEAVARLCEGVLGNPESAARDSFAAEAAGAWLECPQYTRPPSFRGLPVPPVLLAGDHAAVDRWRADQAWRRTWALRPDLRPHRHLPAEVPVFVVEDGRGDMSERTPVPWSAHGVADVVTLGGRLRDLKAARRELRRRHRVDPPVVVVTADPVDPGDLPVARSAAALLDLPALAGDLPALAFLPAPSGDLTPPAGPERPALPAGAVALFALGPEVLQAAELELARTRPMIDSSPPRQVCGSPLLLVVAALSQLRGHPSPPASAARGPDLRAPS